MVDLKDIKMKELSVRHTQAGDELKHYGGDKGRNPDKTLLFLLPDTINVRGLKFTLCVYLALHKYICDRFSPKL